MAIDPLDELFELENTFYKEGYDLGIQDGSRAGRIEGRLFGLEKGFEKYMSLGRLHGRSVIWSGRLSASPQGPNAVAEDDGAASKAGRFNQALNGPSVTRPEIISPSLPAIPYNPRIEKHTRTLHALTEPASLSTENTEEAVSEFDDRLKRAEGKVKIIEISIGESSLLDVSNTTQASSSNGQQPPSTKGDAGIEDMSVLQARH